MYNSYNLMINGRNKNSISDEDKMQPEFNLSLKEESKYNSKL